MADRKPLSRRLRFEVIKRDGYRCVYCGSTPNDGLLHVDHVKPVADGGSDDPTNLVTACAACNLGKSAVPLERRALPPKDPEAAAEHLEQLAGWLESQKAIIAARKDAEQMMVNLWCEVFGEERCDGDVPGRLLKLLSEWSMEKLCEALQITARRPGLYRDVARLKYMYGVFRNWRAERDSGEG